jgi:hypothetical protein
MVAAHIRGSDGSIPSTATTTRAHSSKPYTQATLALNGRRFRNLAASTLGRRSVFLSVSYSGKYSRLSNGQHGFDSRHRCEAHPLDEALHAKSAGSTPARRKPVAQLAEASISNIEKPIVASSLGCASFFFARTRCLREAMTSSANRAKVRSFGASERWVRVPPPRPM